MNIKRTYRDEADEEWDKLFTDLRIGTACIIILLILMILIVVSVVFHNPEGILRYSLLHNRTIHATLRA